MSSGETNAPSGADVDPDASQPAAPQDPSAADAESEAAPPDFSGSIPPADFTTLITMFSTQAMVALGFLAHPASGKPEPNRDLAKHFIDLLGVVEEKSRGNLSSGEQKLLDGTLYELRMAFVQSLKSPPQ